MKGYNEMSDRIWKCGGNKEKEKVFNVHLGIGWIKVCRLGMWTNSGEKKTCNWHVSEIFMFL